MVVKPPLILDYFTQNFSLLISVGLSEYISTKNINFFNLLILNSFYILLIFYLTHILF
ncbi:uncharacterized protein METZ01_LOCUS90091 [marine metagenome]|jgi:hypothetical protein|uniref:Uncharacterized protein n=1 Tax=marine metagenome TaxID=408172 RepID=A0A381VC51_9ZZZZ